MQNKRTYYNRDGDLRIVKKHDECYYTIEGPTIDIGCRSITSEAGELMMFDPPGGPYIEVGCSMSEFGNRKIVSIVSENIGKKDYYKLTIEVEP